MKYVCVFDVDDAADLSKITLQFNDKATNPYNTLYRNVKAKPLPAKKKAIEGDFEFTGDIYGRGWNDCLNEICSVDNMKSV